MKSPRRVPAGANPQPHAGPHRQHHAPRRTHAAAVPRGKPPRRALDGLTTLNGGLPVPNATSDFVGGHRILPEAPRLRLAIPAAIFLLALLVRVAYLIDSAGYPAFTIPIFDARNTTSAARHWLSTGVMDMQFFWQPFFTRSS